MDTDGRVDATRGDDMRHLTVLLVAVAMFVAGCSSETADTTTASSGDVTMTWVFVSGEWPFKGPVTLTGSAVDDGVVCASGQVDNSALDEISRDDEGTTFRLDAEVTCDDGSGSFFVRDDAKQPRGGGDFFGVWTIESGTGNYAQLTGNGTSEWSGEITKTYVGELSRG